ncbi:aldo/keto reductase [Rhodoplanes serenus]|jgi:diketogulonate reductase-like aldo/keto reductase|uniref:aldo/keto reductase n=1 Tax=Rhodoplanes serenus TaxID=200615 RepID=UPI000DAC1447|nr:aldo/keto reductase [Rhodoplanes serenus]RAI34701.1 2,5-didehydrogluconate reductase [Rhodoplanes serenus]
MQVVEANGARIPALGLGTMTLKGDACVGLVEAALRLGYRHLDTAQMYGNEAEVGQGLRAAGVRREEVFVTTKIWHTHLAPADVERSFEESLARLGLSSVDLLLIHWPNPAVPLADTVAALCRTAADGRARHIGVANFTIALVEEAVRLATVPLVTNQIEVHPFIDQRRLIETCLRHGLSVTAYCPLARGAVPADDTLRRIGAAHGRSASQVALRWLVQQGLVAIPRTANRDRLAENLAVFDFVLSETEMAEIAALRRPDGRVVSPPHAPRWDV